jgi:hypothetical protein
LGGLLEDYAGGHEWVDIGLIQEDRNFRLLEGGKFNCFKFQKGSQSSISDVKKALFKRPLYAGASLNLQDLSKSLLFIRQKFQRTMGDEMQASITGLISSILPDGNTLKQCIEDLSSSSSKYNFNNMLYESSGLCDQTKCLSTAQVDICIDGCFPFCGPSAHMYNCPDCKKPRYQHCCYECVNVETGELICNHKRVPVRVMFYNSIHDRIKYLLDSDMGRLFDYPNHRRGCQEGYVDDVYDGTAWKAFQRELQPGEELIGIQACTDGADMFNFSGESE